MTNSPGSSPHTPAKPDATANIVRAGERLYTEEELAVILNKAAEMPEGGQAAVARYTLAQIQEIAAGAGIAPDDVAAAAMALRENRDIGSYGFLGAPWRFRFEEMIDGEVSEEVVGELIDLARRETGLQGSIDEALGTVEWKARDSFGSTYVNVTRRSGRTTVGVLSARTDAAAISGVLAAAGAVFGSVALAVLIGTSGVAAPIAALSGIAGATGGSWLSLRGIWRRVARRHAERTAALSEALITAARRAVEETRVTGM